MISDDRRKRGLRLNGRSDAEIEAMAKVSVGELSAQEFFSDDLNPDEVAERLARMLCASRDEELPTIQSASYRELRAVARSPAWSRPRTTLRPWIALAVAHPNRATKIIPLFSGNCAR